MKTDVNLFGDCAVSRLTIWAGDNKYLYVRGKEGVYEIEKVDGSTWRIRVKDGREFSMIEFSNCTARAIYEEPL